MRRSQALKFSPSVVLGAAIAAALLTFSGPARAWDLADMNRQIDATNFIVNQGCSGTLIDTAKGLILTANHCIDDQYETIEREEVSDSGEVSKKKIRRLLPGNVTKLHFNGTKQVGKSVSLTKLIAYDRGRDLAVVQVVGNFVFTVDSEAKLSCKDPERGEPISIVGNPLGLYSSVVKGVVSSVERTYGTIGVDDFQSSDIAIMQVSGGVVGGNSGGAVYNDVGHIVGVTVRAHRINEVLGFAVPVTEIREFLKNNKIEVPECPK